jgi:hypothetical protein
MLGLGLENAIEHDCPNPKNSCFRMNKIPRNRATYALETKERRRGAVPANSKCISAWLHCTGDRVYLLHLFTMDNSTMMLKDHDFLLLAICQANPEIRKIAQRGCPNEHEDTIPEAVLRRLQPTYDMVQINITQLYIFSHFMNFSHYMNLFFTPS